MIGPDARFAFGRLKLMVASERDCHRRFEAAVVNMQDQSQGATQPPRGVFLSHVLTNQDTDVSGSDTVS